MANIEEQGGGRQIAIEPNIVPFIDLMSVLITFLLITAVWSQVSMIQLGSSVYSKKTSEMSTPPPKVDVVLRIDVLIDGFRVVIGNQTTMLEKLNGEYDFKRLIEYLKTIKQNYDQKTDATVTILDELPYGYLIESMDAIMLAGFSDVAVGAVGVN